MLSPHPQSQRAAALGVLFALLMLLIIYSSGSGSEVFPYSRLRGRARRPPDLKKWGVKSGYLPVCGNKVRGRRRGIGWAAGAGSGPLPHSSGSVALRGTAVPRPLSQLPAGSW